MDESAVLFAEVMGGSRLIVALGADEGGRTVERCMHRIDVAVSGHHGQVLERMDARMLIIFPDCEAAALAYADMLHKVQSMPPQRGVHLALRAGLHHPGHRITGADDPAVRVAEAMMRVAADDQAFASLSFCNKAGLDISADAGRSLMVDGSLWEARPLSGHETPVHKHVVPVADAPAEVKAPAVGLRVRHREQTVVLDESNPSLSLGRDRACQVTIEDKRASRVHAMLELRGGVPYLIDQSSNGTSLVIVGEEEQWLRRSEQALTGMGRFGCGFTCGADQEPGGPDLRVYFEPL